MIDLEKMRWRFVGVGARAGRGSIYRNADCAIEALSREVEEQRSLISELRRDSDMRYNRMTYEAEQHAQLRVQYDDLRRERDELRRENKILKEDCERLRQRTGGTPDPYYETQPGSPNFEGGAAWERYLDEEPTWLPAPDSQPADMADAQHEEQSDD